MTNLDEVVLHHSVAPHKPRYLCTIPPSTLLFEDVSKQPSIVFKFDLSIFPWWISDITQAIPAALKKIWDISFTEHKGKQLVFIADGYNGLLAYNGCTGEREWRVDEDDKFFAGITTDKRGHLFRVDDIDNVVKMYTAEGSSLGVLQLEKDEFPDPWRISWCRETSSLILAHTIEWDRFISVINVKYPE